MHVIFENHRTQTIIAKRQNKECLGHYSEKMYEKVYCVK